MQRYSLLRSVGAFQGLRDEDLDRLDRELEYVAVERGQPLVRQGDPAEELYLVLSGRFLVTVAGQREPVAEIAAGTPIGEIAFFSGGTRTATVEAARDSVVLRLGRDQFQATSKTIPGLTESLLTALAERLAAATARLPDKGSLTPPRTIAIVPAGQGKIPAGFIDQLHGFFDAFSPTPLLTSTEVTARTGGEGGVDGRSATAWMNELEGRHDHVIYVADPGPSRWSSKVIRQADQIILVAAPDAGRAPNDLERRALKVHRRKHLRLVLLHETREDYYEGTARWLEERDVFLHHHVALDTPADSSRLRRFITGHAIGLVACGGGAFCSAHVGVYHALLDAGIEVDIFAGSSGGAAMAGAFARGAPPDEIDEGTHEIFVTRRAMRHPTIPKYGLIDHKLFDGPLRDHYGDVPIEDIAIPYFALATSLSSGEPVVIRRGPHWEAIRASASIPGLLPPFITRDGDLLVDGSLSDNVPLAAMRAIKSGPNVVIDFAAAQDEKCTAKYADIPGRRQLARHLLSLFRGRGLPSVPGIPTVVLRSLMMHGRLRTPLSDTDLLLTPPLPPDMGILDWQRHTELMKTARAYAAGAIEKAREAGHPLFPSSVDATPVSSVAPEIAECEAPFRE